jgi:hypothetical protein
VAAVAESVAVVAESVAAVAESVAAVAESVADVEAESMVVADPVSLAAWESVGDAESVPT